MYGYRFTNFCQKGNTSTQHCRCFPNIINNQLGSKCYVSKLYQSLGKLLLPMYFCHQLYPKKLMQRIRSK